MLFRACHIKKHMMSTHSPTGDVNCDHLARLVNADVLRYEVTIILFVFNCVLVGDVSILC